MTTFQVSVPDEVMKRYGTEKLHKLVQNYLFELQLDKDMEECLALSDDELVNI